MEPILGISVLKHISYEKVYLTYNGKKKTCVTNVHYIAYIVIKIVPSLKYKIKGDQHQPYYQCFLYVYVYHYILYYEIYL